MTVSVSESGTYPQFRSVVIDVFPEGTTTEYQFVCPWEIVPTVMGFIIAGRLRFPTRVTEYPLYVPTSCAETPDMSMIAQTRIIQLVPDTFIVYR
jgi:hypothetical protein